METHIKTLHKTPFCKLINHASSKTSLLLEQTLLPPTFELNIEETILACHKKLSATEITPALLDITKNNTHLKFQEIEAIPLNSLIKKEPLTQDKILLLATSLCKTLSELHTQNILHLSLTPFTICVNTDTQKTYLLDFSYAKFIGTDSIEPTKNSTLERNLTQFLYLSPEQSGRMSMPTDYRSDLYALGCILYQVTTGIPPFPESDIATLIHAHIAKTPTSPNTLNSKISITLSELILKLLKKNPDDRYQSISAIENDLLLCTTKEKIDKTFTPGNQDITKTPKYGYTLYQKKSILEELTKLHEKTNYGNTSLTLLSGQTGIGKSSTLKHFIKNEDKKSGLFALGRYEEDSILTLGGLQQAIKSLLSSLLAQDPDTVSLWKTRLSKLSLETRSILRHILPEIEQLTDFSSANEMPESPDIHLKFKDSLIALIKIFPSKNRPLIIGLDNLEYADQESLDILATLLKDPNMNHLLIVATLKNTTRPNPSRPLESFLETIPINKPSTLYITELHMPLIEEKELSPFLQNHFQLDPTLTNKLSNTILSKTNGNPLAIINFLKSLTQKELLYIDPKTNTWNAQVGNIQNLEVSENMAELLIQQIDLLPKKIQRILEAAACIERKFTSLTLQLITNYSKQIIEDSIQKILALELLQEDTLPDTFKFSHHIIQKTIYNRIPIQSKETYHRHISMDLIKQYESTPENRLLLETVHHINLTAYLTKEQALTFARFNYKAALLAKSTATYDHALLYLEKAKKHSNTLSWKLHHTLLFEIYFLDADCTFLTGSSQKAETLFSSLLTKAQLNQEKLTVGKILISLYHITGELDKAEQIEKETLRLFKISLPSLKILTFLTLAFELIKFKFYLRNRLPIELENLPPLKKPEIVESIQLLTQMSGITYEKSPLLFRLILLKMATLSLKYGNSSQAGIAYIAYGFICISQQKLELGYQFGKLGIAIEKRYPEPKETGRIQSSFYGIISPWKIPFRQNTLPLQDSFQHCQLSGDNWFGSTAIQLKILLLIFAGNPLPSIEKEFENHREHILNNGYSTASFLAYEEFISLLKHPQPTPWQQISRYKENLKKSLTGLGGVLTFELMFNYLHQDFKAAQKISDSSNGILKESEIVIIYPEYLLFQALTYTQKTSLTILERHRIKKTIKKFDIWSQSCPENFLCKHLLIKADYQRINKQHKEAFVTYNQALLKAKEFRNLYIEAITHQRLATFYTELNLQPYTLYHASLSKEKFQKWGASTIVFLLETQYPEIKSEIQHYPYTYTDTNENSLLKHIDIDAFTKASLALSQEIVIEILLEKLVPILLVNSGAEKTHILLKSNNELFLEASGDSTTNIPTTNLHIPLQETTDLPQKIINFVYKTKKPFITGDVIEEVMFYTDSYIINHNPKSILCLPILKQSQIIGVLYLENSLTFNVFTQDQIKTLNLLASQAAISIENAILYKENQDLIHNLETRVEKQVEEIKTATELEQKSRETAEKLAQQTAFSDLTRGIAHEIRNPMGMMLSSSELIVDNLDDKTAMSQYAYIIKSNIMRLTKVTNTMLRYGGKINADKTSGIVTDIINDILLAAKAECKNKGIHLTKHLEKTPEIPMDPNSISQAILNILLNAIQSIPTGGALHVETSLENFTNLLGKETSGIKIYITDTGCGIPKENMSKLFDPFFSTKYENSGLGLAIVQRTIFEHNGTIEITSERDKGTQVTVYLPTR